MSEAWVSDYGKKIRKEFFLDIEENRWKEEERSYNNYEEVYHMGTNELGNYTNGPRNMVYGKVILTIQKNSKIITISSFKRQNNDYDETINEKVREFTLRYLKEKNLDYLIFMRNRNHNGVENNYFPTGENSEKVKSVIQKIKKHLVIIESKTLYMYSKMNRLELDVFSGVSPYIEIKDANTRNTMKVIKNEEDMIEFKKEMERDEKDASEVKEEIVRYISDYEKTAYYSNNDRSFYIFNQRVPFDIKKTVGKNSSSFKARIWQGYLQDKNLSKLKEKITKRLEKYIVRNRMESAISGEANNFIKKLAFMVYKEHVNTFSYDKNIETKLKEYELNEILKEIITEPIERREKEEDLIFAQYIIKMKKKRNKVTSFSLLGNLLLIETGTKLFVIPKKEVKEMDFNSLKFKTKKEKELLLPSLEKEKEKI